MSTSTSSASGSTSTPAALVWMRPCDSVTGTRCTRCTPPSNFSRPPHPAGLRRLDRDADVLVAAEVARIAVEHLGGPALPLGVAQVHPQQIAGEQRRLLAALARLDLEDHVLVVVRVARQQQLLQPVAEAFPLGLRVGRPPRGTTASSRRARRGLPGRPRARRELARPSQRSASARRSARPSVRARPGRRAPPGRRAARSRSACSASISSSRGGLRSSLGLSSLRRASGSGRNTNGALPHDAGRRRIEASGCRRRARRPGACRSALELLDAATDVEDLLLAGVERVALRADLGVDLAVGSRCCGW